MGDLNRFKNLWRGPFRNHRGSWLLYVQPFGWASVHLCTLFSQQLQIFCANVRLNSSNTHECRCISQVHCINTSVDTVCPNIALMFCTIPPEGFKFGRGRLYGFPDIQTQHLLEKWESNMFVLLCVRLDCCVNERWEVCDESRGLQQL